MGQLAKRRIHHAPVVTPSDDPMSDWEALDDHKREIAQERLLLITPILQAVEDGTARAAAIRYQMAAIEAGDCDPRLVELSAKHGKRGKPISRATWNNWMKAYTEHGKLGLAPKHRGSQRKAWGWEARFRYYYNRPTRPRVLTVAYWLRTRDGFESATNDRVYRYAKSLSAKDGDRSRQRLGGHYHDQNVKPYRLLDSTVLPVGYMWEGDGHCCDVYVQHPVSGNHYRPELTIWIDKRSNYLVGWTLSETENAINTIQGLLLSMSEHDHVPAQLHVDPGSGFKNKAVSDQLHGLCARLAIEPKFALPGNARGKGLVEGWFHHFEERCGKLFESFCGHCRTDDLLARLETKIKRGQIEIPTQAQYHAAIQRYVEDYNNTVQRNLGASPAELWLELDRTPLNHDLDALYRVRHIRQVRQSTISVDSRKYRDHELAFYDGMEVIVEVDPRSYDSIVVRDADGRFICEAALQHRAAYQSASLIEQKKLDSKKAAIERKRKHIEEIERRSGRVVDHEKITRDLEDFQTPDLPDRSEQTPGVPFDMDDIDAEYFSPSPSRDDDDDPFDYL